MEIKQLKYFVSIIDTGNFSEASKRCNLTQSAISQQIKTLESELKTDLFIRTSHGVTITESGKDLLPFARRAIKGWDECYEHMKSMDSVCGELKVGIGNFIEPYIRAVAVEMKKRFPDVRLNIIYTKSKLLNTMLKSREIDLAFTMNLAYPDEEIESTPMIPLRLCAIMTKGHPLSVKDKVTFDELKEYEVIMPDVDHRVLQSIKNYYDVPIENMKSSIIVNDPCAALNLVQELDMITFLPCRYVKDRPLLVAKPIVGLENVMMSNAHVLKDVHVKKSVREFIKLVKRYGTY